MNCDASSPPNSFALYRTVFALLLDLKEETINILICLIGREGEGKLFQAKGFRVISGVEKTFLATKMLCIKQSKQKMKKSISFLIDIHIGLLCESATCICGWDCKCCGCMVATWGDSELDSSNEKLFILSDIFLRCCGLWGAVRSRSGKLVTFFGFGMVSGAMGLVWRSGVIGCEDLRN